MGYDDETIKLKNKNKQLLWENAKLKNLNLNLQHILCKEFGVITSGKILNIQVSTCFQIFLTI